MVALGEGVAESWKDVLVVVNPTNGWPAGVSEAPAMHDLSILGMPRDGTLAEYVVVDVSRVHRKPEHLSEVEAAALPLAGVTAFRALFHQAQAKRGSKVFVTGIGSGVATFVVQFAAAIGCQIVVSSGSQEKLDAALARHPLLGGVLYTAPTKEWTKDALNYIKNEGFDIVIDGAGGKDFNELLKLLKPGGRLVSYGATVGKPADFDIFRVFLLQLKILGTSMGSDEDFAEMLKFVEEHRIIPVIAHVHPWEVRQKQPPLIYPPLTILTLKDPRTNYPSTDLFFFFCRTPSRQSEICANLTPEARSSSSQPSSKSTCIF